MKTTKKLATLFLALMMALSCMAMPAMAAGRDDGASTQGRVEPSTQTCSICGEKMFWVYAPDNVHCELVCINGHNG